MRRDRSAVSAGLDQFWSNGKVEWQAHRLKLLKRQMHGRSGSLLLRRRVLPFYPTVEARHLTHYEVPTKVRKNLFQTGADTFSCRTPQEDREGVADWPICYNLRVESKRPLRGIALLLDCRPLSWTSREDMHIAVCRALLERGVQPVMVFSEISGVLRRTYEDAGVIVEEVNYRRGAAQYFRRMRTIFRQYHVDMVDIEFFAYFDPIAWIARFNGVKNIVFTESNSGVMRARSWKAALLRLRAALVTAPVRRFVAISDFVRQQMLLLGLEDARISVVHKGIDLRRYLPDAEARDRLMDRYGGRPDEIILGTVTIMRRFKHPEVILEACALLQKRNVPFRLFVAGGGELGPEMEALAVRLGIANRVHWLGYVDRPEYFMRGWDVFLLASEGEAFGFVMVEAMCCGVPVVASASGAIPEIVEHGRTGFVTPLLDADAMAEAIRSLAQDESLRREMAAACVARVRDQFSVDGAVEKTLRVYESMWSAEEPARRRSPARG